MAGRKTEKAMTFEQGLERLETIAGQMERSELPLDELMKLYEEGMKLSRELTQKLDEIDGRMMEVQPGQETAAQTDVVRQESLLDALDNV